MKKSRFNKIVSDLGAKKAFVMAFLRRPILVSADGIRALLLELTGAMRTKEYADMLAESAQKTEKLRDLKSLRDQARLHFRRGKREAKQRMKTLFARQYQTGVLQKEMAAAEAAHGARNQDGLASLLPSAR